MSAHSQLLFFFSPILHTFVLLPPNSKFTYYPSSSQIHTVTRSSFPCSFFFPQIFQIYIMTFVFLLQIHTVPSFSFPQIVIFPLPSLARGASIEKCITCITIMPRPLIVSFVLNLFMILMLEGILVWFFSDTSVQGMDRVMLTCKAKVVCLVKIWWSFLKYLEVITIGIKLTLMKIRRFDGIHVDHVLNAHHSHGLIIRREYLMFVIHIVDIVAFFSAKLFGNLGYLSLSWSFRLQLLKIDLGSILRAFSLCMKLGEGGLW